MKVTTDKSDNELIAEFMGGKFSLHRGMTFIDGLPFCVGQQTPMGLKYHKSWDWLMPVAEKISRIRCAPKSDNDYDTFFPRTFGMLSPEGRKPMVRINGQHVHEADTLIEATYSAVVEFIKWYNANKL